MYPPGPKIRYWKGILAQFFNPPPEAQLNAMLSSARKYGDIVYFRVGGDQVYMLNHPDYIHEALVEKADKFHKSRQYKEVLARFLGNGLLVSDGEFWRRQRRLAQPAFHHKRIEAYSKVMVDYTLRMLEGWRDGERRDMAREMMRLTLFVVAKTLFDADLSGEADAIGQAFTALQETTDKRIGEFIPIPDWFPTDYHRKERQALAALDKIILHIIEERRKSGEDKGDLLSMLLMAQDDDGTQMTDKQLRDEVTTLFLAGHETTANALAWSWFLLSQNPEVEAKLHREVDEVLNGRTPMLEDLKQLPYTEMVIKEAMRIYPPAWAFNREAIEGVEIGGYLIPKGAMISMSPYVTHRDARWFPEPLRFIPERFVPESEKQLPKYAYFPFGGGPRICIGNTFAMMEARLILATMAQQFSFELVGEHEVKPEPLITLRPKGGLAMRLRAKAERVKSEATLSTLA
jgi:cytochrome P450